MIQYSDTTVFNVDAQTIVNTVNCMGVMGAGLALEFRLRYPLMFDDYDQRCKRKEVEVGKPYLYKGYVSPWILNFPTKDHWKYHSKLSWIESGLADFVNTYLSAGITSIAFPKLGTNKGGLDWTMVQPIMEKYLTNIPITTYICLDREVDASGIEHAMVELLNNSSPSQWEEQFELSKRTTEAILRQRPIRRFYQLLGLPAVSAKSYERLFQFYYGLAKSTNTDAADIKLIDGIQQLTLL